MNIPEFYYYIYNHKFKNKPFINTECGFIYSHKVDLYINNLDSYDNIMNITKFIKMLDFEGDILKIKLSDDLTTYHTETLAETYHTETYHTETYPTCDFCGAICNMPMIVFNGRKYCCKYKDKCTYTKSILDFNMYEWIPVGKFLENRNPNSIMYLRKIKLIPKENHIEFDLIHSKVDYFLNYKDTLRYDKVYKILDHYNIPPFIDDKIVNLVLTS